MGNIGKELANLNIFDPVMHHWGQGAFDSSRKGKRGEFKNLAEMGKNMTPEQKRQFRAREAAKASGAGGGDTLGVQSPLTSRYS